MTLTVYKEMIQGTPEWHAARLGILTASEMDMIITPATMKAASNKDQRAHLHELCAQRITQNVEQRFVTDDMQRGHDGEIEALEIYDDAYEPITRVGFMTRAIAVEGGEIVIGGSPDALVGLDGGVEVKCPRAKLHLATLLAGTMPTDHIIQVQTLLLVSGRKWWDFVSHHAGLPMFTVRIYPDAKIHAAIIDAAASFYVALKNMRAMFDNRVSSPDFRLIPTVRTTEMEIS